MAKPSEDTLTTIFKEILSENDINVEAFPIWNTPVGIRKPDLLCRNEKYYPLEAKIKEEDLIKDIVKIQNDYFKFANELNVGGAFVLKHPNPKRLKLNVTEKELKKKFKNASFQLILMFPEGDNRQFEILKGKLNELIPIIIDTINYKRIKETLEPSAAIEILRKATKYLEIALENIKMDILIEKMGGIELFEDLMDINIKKNHTSIKAAISFFILTQLLFYHVVAFYRHDLDPLDDIKKVKDLKENYFDKIIEINYQSIFSVDIVSHLLDTAVDQLNVIISTLKSLKPENIKGDLIGTIFHDLIPLDIRKRVAAYYTNILATELLANLTIDDPDIKVGDLACGSAGLLVAAYRRKEYLIKQNKKSFTKDDHRKIIKEDLFGIDIMPFATNIASCNLGLQSPQFLTDSVNIGLWDSIDLQPGDTIPEFAKLYFLFRSRTIDAWTADDTERRIISDLKVESDYKGFPLEKTDLLLMNPPFTRHERLPLPYKARLRQRFRKYVESGVYNEQMGLHGVFILLGDLFLKKGGRMGLVLPASTLARRSFDALRRRFICENYCIELIIYNTSRLNFSESTLWREILLILRKEKPKDFITKVCRLTRFPDSVKETNEIASLIKNNQKSDKFEILQISQDLLKSMKDWSSITIVSDLFKKIYDTFEKLDIMTTLIPRFECIRTDFEHFKTKSKLSCFIQNTSRLNSDQLKESWVGFEIRKNYLTVRNAEMKGIELVIPQSKIRKGFRTTSNIKVINVDKILGYILVSPFNKMKEKFLKYIFDDKKLKGFDFKEFDKILRRFENRNSYLILNRRLYLASPGTSYVAFCSNTPFIGVDTWGFTNMNYDEAKLIAHCSAYVRLYICFLALSLLFKLLISFSFSHDFADSFAFFFFIANRYVDNLLIES